MATNIQVRAVDEALADAAKRRAKQAHLSLSGYVRGLIERDIAEANSRGTMRGILDEIAYAARPRASRMATAAALAEVRRELGDQ